MFEADNREPNEGRIVRTRVKDADGRTQAYVESEGSVGDAFDSVCGLIKAGMVPGWGPEHE